MHLRSHTNAKPCPARYRRERERLSRKAVVRRRRLPTARRPEGSPPDSCRRRRRWPSGGPFPHRFQVRGSRMLAASPMSSVARNFASRVLRRGRNLRSSVPNVNPPARVRDAPCVAAASYRLRRRGLRSATRTHRPRHGSRQADDNVQHEFKTVQALRGRESSAKAKWQAQGWEFVSEDRGTLRTELNFRRVKPKTLGSPPPEHRRHLPTNAAEDAEAPWSRHAH